MSAPVKVRVGLGLWILAWLASPCLGQEVRRTAVLATPRFAFFSDLDTNLNDALIAAGLARKGGKPELFRSGAEASCFEKLPPGARAGWDAAVDAYARVISPVDWNAREQFVLRMDLVGFDTEGRSAGDAELVGIARGLRGAATPAYRACRWAAQDEQNRRWIAELKPRLAAHEEKVAARLERLYRKSWKTLPVLVDVVETVNWSGANTTWSDAGQGDVLITSTVSGPPAFETLLHEASHVLMDRGDPVRQALEKAAKDAGLRLPGDFWHVVLFYTTGEAVRPFLDEGAATPYTPMLYEIFARGSWGSYRKALEEEWLPYVKGTASLEEAAARLVAALKD